MRRPGRHPRAVAPHEQGHEVILVDGGSGDATVALARPLVDQLLTAPAGRALQMNLGAQAARGRVLWFLHADTRVPEHADRLINAALRDTSTQWGHFEVQLSEHRFSLQLVATLMNIRSRLSGIATGDQGIFVERGVFDRLGGFPNQPLMEDIALSRRLRKQGRPVCIRGARLQTSSRRWEKYGTMQTIWLMWRLRLAFALGADPHRLARRYHP